jgi:hypothetical protein
MLLGYKEIIMNLKNIITKIVVKEAAGKLLPMADVPKPALGKKAKIAGLLGVIATVAAAGAQYLAG